MSRSVRHTPIHGVTTARSERSDKKQWHHALRQKEKQKLGSGPDLDAHIATDRREVSSPWLMAKDGKHYWPLKQQREVARRCTDAIAANDAKAYPRALHKFSAK